MRGNDMTQTYGFERWDTDIFAESYLNRERSFLLAFSDQTYQAPVWQETERADEDAVFCKMRAATGCHFLLVVWREQEEDRLCMTSDTPTTRAKEFMDFLIEEFGLVKGNADVATGRISTAILRARMTELDFDRKADYYMRRSTAYFEDCSVIEAASYVAQTEDAVRTFLQYRKKRMPWAYVLSTQIAGAGESIRIRTLENTTGMTLTADPDTYIMIGCKGEVYNISRDKFASTYEATQEQLDVFEQMLPTFPEAELVENHAYVSLDEMARLCYPKRGVGIYAKELTRRTKVFPADGDGAYYLGLPGDYLAIRSEDPKDIYIIRKDVFVRTYEGGL